MVEWTAAWWLLQTSLTHTLTTHTLAHITVTASSLVHQRCLRHSPKQGSDANAPLALTVKVRLKGLDLGPMHHRPPPTATSHEHLKTCRGPARRGLRSPGSSPRVLARGLPPGGAPGHRSLPHGSAPALLRRLPPRLRSCRRPHGKLMESSRLHGKTRLQNRSQARHRNSTNLSYISTQYALLQF